MIKLCFRDQISQRLILGACWGRGLDPAADDTEQAIMIEKIITDLCREEIQRQYGTEAKKGAT